MLDAASASLLANVLRRESLSVLQYAGEAFPWSRAEDRDAVLEIRRLWAEDRERIGELTRFLHKSRIRPPFIGTFPSGFTTLNFIGLDFLLKKLIDDQKRAIRDLEADVSSIASPEVREPLQHMLDTKKTHLPILEQLSSKRTVPAA
jgi:demethoxyubiquinone hydroxylase (CLK1/Coq7/Cat5 family)